MKRKLIKLLFIPLYIIYVKSRYKGGNYENLWKRI